MTGVSLAVGPGELVALLGPNGAGKTTFLRAALGLIPRCGGTSRLGGQDAARLSAGKRARLAAYLPQRRPLAWPNRVRDLVALGRFARGSGPGRLRGEDRRAVARAIAACGLERLAHRSADTLSGGELALVHCARAFAAETPLLTADEPVAALDPGHQHRVMGLLRSFVQTGGGALVVLHDMALAGRWADRIAWMREGRLVTSGPPRDVLSGETIARTYGMVAAVEWRGPNPVILVEGPAPRERDPGDLEA